MLKRFMGVFLTIAMLFLITACGSANNNTIPNSDAGEKEEPSSIVEKAINVAELDITIDKNIDYTQGDKLIIKYGHTNELESPLSKGVDNFAKALDEITSGRIIVEVYPASQLGGNDEVLEQLQLGTTEMCCSAVAMLGSFTDTTAILDLPFLFKTEEAAAEVLDSDIISGIYDGVEKVGIKCIAWFEDGFRQLTSRKEVHLPEDLKNIKIRVMDNKMHIDLWNTLGSSATPMAASEVYTAIQNGTVDAQENSLPTIESHRFQEVAKYIVMSKHIYAATPMLASKSWWDGLSSSDQDLIERVAKGAVEWQRSVNRSKDEELYKEWSKNGFNEIIDLTDDEYKQWKNKVEPIYEAYIQKYGDELIERIDSINEKY